MGRSPKKKPEAPKAPEGAPKDAAPETDNKGGTVRKRRGGKAPSPQKMEMAADALHMLAEAGAEPAKWGDAYNNAAKVYGADSLNAALTAKGVDLSKWLPKTEASSPPTNVVTQQTMTTGDVVPVTSSDNSMPPVPTAEQAAALQALGLKGGNAAQAAAADKIAPPQKASAAPPSKPSIKEMIGMLMGKGAYVEPVEVPPVLSQVREVDPAVAAAQPTVQLRTQELQPRPATQPFRFPAGFDPGFDDGRVQLGATDYSAVRPVVADATTPVQWYARQGSDASQTPQQLSGKKEPDQPDPFADIPLNTNKGAIGMYRNRKNIANRAVPYVAGGSLIAALTALGARAMMGQGSAQPQTQPQGPDPDETILMNTNTVGGFR